MRSSLDIAVREEIIGRYHLPNFSLPDSAPNNQRLTHLLCYVLVECLNSSAKQSQIPRRMIQREWTISDGVPVSARLRKLAADGWVTQVKIKEFGRAALYSPGPLLENNPLLEEEWLKFADSIHGENGLLKNCRHRPARAHGCLNTNGLLILATLEYAMAPMRVKEIEIYLKDFMTSKTVKSYLKRLTSYGLIHKAENGYQVVPDLETALNLYEASLTTASQRKQRVKQQTYNETRAFQREQNPDGKLSERSKQEWRWGDLVTSSV